MQFLEECSQLGSPLARLQDQSEQELLVWMKDSDLLSSQPISSSLVDRLKVLSADDDASPGSLANLVVTDPFLTIRLLHLASSSLFTKSQATFSLDVIIQKLGLRRVAETVNELTGRRQLEQELKVNSTALLAYQEFILSVVLTRNIFRGISQGAEEERLAVLCTSLRLLPRLFLSTTRSEIAAALSLEPILDEQSFYEKNFKQLLGLAPADFSARLLENLQLPDALIQIVKKLDIAPWNRRFSEGTNLERFRKPIQASYSAVKMTREILSFRDSHYLTNVLREFESRLGVARQIFIQAMSGLSLEYQSGCRALGILDLPLPSYLESYTDKILESDGSITKELVEWPSSADRIKPFMLELKDCLAERHEKHSFSLLRQALTCTLNGLVRALDFDRAVFYRIDSDDEQAEAVFILGRIPRDEHKRNLKLSLVGDLTFRPDFQCIRKETAVFQGDPLFGEDWPMVAFPVIWNGKVRGFFYADRKYLSDAEPLSLDQQMVIVALSEQWRQVPFDFF